MKYFIKIAYDGSKFYGFQRLKGKKTVQKELEKALSIINKKDVLVKGAGRTDALVHAYNQGVHFVLDYDIPPQRLKEAINSIVFPYIKVRECRKVDDNFHARFDVVSKTYVYKIYTGDYNPFKYDYFLEYSNNIEIDKLKDVANILIGKHDFHNFVAGRRDNYNAEVFKIDFKVLDEEIWIIFEGKSFYRYMVRNMVGAMLDYNEGKCDLETIRKMIEDKNFNKQLRTAPAQGLYLADVSYKNL